MRTVLGVLLRYFLIYLVNVFALLAVTAALPGVRFDTTVPHWRVVALLLPVEFALVIIVLRPLLVLLTLPLNAVTLGLPTLLFNGLLLALVTEWHSVIIVTHVGNAVLGLALITLASAGAAGLLGVDETYPFFQSVLGRLGRRLGPPRPAEVRRGLLLLQVDGLSHASLRRALLRGRMPAVSSLLARGSHQLHRWRTGLPSNTPAVQAGLLFGSRHDAPGYRWYDRAAGRARAASVPEDLRLLEKRAAEAGRGALLAGGSCINSFLSGGAAKRLLTLSAQRDITTPSGRAELTDFNLFWLSPFDYTKAMVAAAWDFATALAWTLLGRLAGHRLRVRRSLKQSATRAVGNAFLRETAYFWIRQDLLRGTPVIYSNFVGYDEVAHYGGPDSYEALASLAAFDRKLRRLLRLVRGGAPIGYDVVLLSDHGHTPSVPFRHLYGRTLEEVIATLAGRHVPVPAEPLMGATMVASLLRELESARPAGLPPAAVRSRRTLARLQDPAQPEAAAAGDAPQVVVCVSGCLAHVYLTGRAAPATLAEVQAAVPGLVEGLAGHPGIEFVVARRGEDGAVAIGADGLCDLRTGELHGTVDPLAVYTDRQFWAAELARLATSPSAGDLIVNGAWLPPDRVVVFEEQISSHGGLGGGQNEPFLVAPAEIVFRRGDLQTPEALHARLLARRRELGSVP